MLVETFVLMEGFTWPDVAIAGIGIVPSTLTVVLAYLNRQALKTPSGTPIGTQVEDVNHMTIVNHHRLNAVGEQVGLTPAPSVGYRATDVRPAEADRRVDI